MTITKLTRRILILRGHPLLRNNNSRLPVRKVVNRLGIRPVNGGLLGAIVAAAMSLSTTSSELSPLSKSRVMRTNCIKPITVTFKADSPRTLLDSIPTNPHPHKRLACVTIITMGPTTEGSPTVNCNRLSPISMAVGLPRHKVTRAQRAHRPTFHPSATIRPSSSHRRRVRVRTHRATTIVGHTLLLGPQRGTRRKGSSVLVVLILICSTCMSRDNRAGLMELGFPTSHPFPLSTCSSSLEGKHRGRVWLLSLRKGNLDKDRLAMAVSHYRDSSVLRSTCLP